MPPRLFPYTSHMKYGCLIVALGTPASPAPADIADFLQEFLSDPAVVDFPAWLWKPILRHIVLKTRPEKIRPQYEHIWLEDGSPLQVYTQAQAAALQAELPEVAVAYANTYTAPRISETIARLVVEEGVEELVIIPLYPQYAPSTVCDIRRQAEAYCAGAGAPRLHWADSWQIQEQYVAWHAEKLQEKISRENPDKIIFSFHGVPLRAAHAPTSYFRQCTQTVAAIMGRVGDYPHEITFQSKFGPGKWLHPATIGRMRELPREGVKNILLLTPGFFADCIETPYELDVLNKGEFQKAGGEKFTRLAPPNSDAAAGKILAALYREILPS